MDIDVGPSLRPWTMVRLRAVRDMALTSTTNVRAVVESLDGCSAGIGDGTKSIEDAAEGCPFPSCSFPAGHRIAIEVPAGELSELQTHGSESRWYLLELTRVGKCVQ